MIGAVDEGHVEEGDVKIVNISIGEVNPELRHTRDLASSDDLRSSCWVSELMPLITFSRINI